MSGIKKVCCLALAAVLAVGLMPSFVLASETDDCPIVRIPASVHSSDDEEPNHQNGILVTEVSQEGISALAAPRKDLMTIVLDPGHGGYDKNPGPTGLLESQLSLKIALYCKAYLESTNACKVVMTRSTDVFVPLEERSVISANAGADLFVSFHINAAGGTGFEVWVQNDSSWNNQFHGETVALGKAILDKLCAFGFANRGTWFNDNRTGIFYPDGSPADALNVLRNNRFNNVPAVLIEHGFIDTAKDIDFLSKEENLKAMGEADAKAIIETYGLDGNSLMSYYAPVYDHDYYVSHNADVKNAFGGDRALSFRHFLESGMAEHRQASASFDPMSYYNEYPDVRKQYNTTYWQGYYQHFIDAGKKEGRHGTGCTALVTGDNAMLVYRLYNPMTSEHLYTRDYNEYLVLGKSHGWKQEGSAWIAPEKEDSTCVAVYRLFNADLNGHLYTSDANEISVLTSKYGWVYDFGGKPVFYSVAKDAKGSMPVYRLYNESLHGQHHLTVDKNEYSILPQYGWKQEGVSYYSLPL